VAVAAFKLVIIALFICLAGFMNRIHLQLFKTLMGIWGMIGLGFILLGFQIKENMLRPLTALQILTKENI